MYAFLRYVPIPALLLIGLFWSACQASDSPRPAETGPGSSNLPRDDGDLRNAFDAHRSWADLVYLCETIGPRPLGSPGAEATRAYLRSQLEAAGWAVEEDRSWAATPPGAERTGPFEVVNLLARRPGNEPGELWICSHYDSFDLPGFVGANDSGSSTAVLLELGRILGGTGPRSGPALVLCFFDGEEPFYDLPWDDVDNSTFGSRHLARKLQRENRLQNIRALVLLDMVGDRDLQLSVETRSDPRLRRLFHQAAGQMQDSSLVAGRREIKDDHLPFQRAGVATINLIDFQFGPQNRWWHSREDTLEKCSAESLGRTGRLVLTALPLLEKRFP
ncbi:MAG: hypothetical protein DWQ01_02915 [Planctomycetota bacterium]|nr:MAG: hypothetical protein DWQ01_02915 [Planctomycetota bacterium]